MGYTEAVGNLILSIYPHPLSIYCIYLSLYIFFSLKKRRLKGDLTYIYKYLQGGCQEDEARFFSVVPSDRTRDNGPKLKHTKFHLKTRKNFFTLKVREHGNRLPRGVVDSPSLELFKTCLDAVLCNLL